MRRLKAGLSLSTPTLQQQVLAMFLADGALDRHLRLLRATVHREMTAMVLAVQRSFPEECRLIMPRGGNMLWLELPTGIDSTWLYRQAIDNGISIVPGAAFTSTDRFRNYIRLSCNTSFSERMAEAVETLGRLVNKGTRS
jgi:DNA-binding transcriptional MocR family regulator